MDLADRVKPQYPDGTRHFESLIPLMEMLGEIFSVGSGSKKVFNQYQQLISLFGSEFNIFRQAPIEDLNNLYSPILGEAIRRVRKGEVIRKPGFDGEFGVIKVFEEKEVRSFAKQASLLTTKKK